MVLNSVVYPCVLIILVTAGQMAAEVASDKEWGFFVCVCLFELSSIESSFSLFSI